MKKTLAAALVLIALCAQAAAGVMTTGPAPQEPPAETQTADAEPESDAETATEPESVTLASIIESILDLF